MSRIFPILCKERIRRTKALIKQKPWMTLSIAATFVYLIYCCLTADFATTVLLINMDYVALIGSVYLIGKILNPTQGMVIDYQLIQGKLISFRQYQFLIGLKLYGGSILGLLVLFVINHELIYILLLLNSVVNVYVFLRNKYHTSWLNLVLAVVIAVLIYFENVVLAGTLFVAVSAVFVVQKNVNYEEILPLYKMMQVIGQRYRGVQVTAEKNREMQNQAERLVGKKKVTHTDWCEKYYDRPFLFGMWKELSRIHANIGQVHLYIAINFLVCVIGLYLPDWYIAVACLIEIMLVYSFVIQLNKDEKSLFFMGFLSKYRLRTILKEKWLIYALFGMLIASPIWIATGVWGIVMLPLAAVVSLCGLIKSFI